MQEVRLVLQAVELMHKIQWPGMITAVGHHMGVHEYLDEHLTPEEKEIIEPLSPRKKREWLASRTLLFALSGEPQRIGCVYDDFGKPILRGSDKHISISHSELWCAAMISDRPCGVDIQVYSETVKRIAERFLTEDEVKAAFARKNALAFLHLLWGGGQGAPLRIVSACPPTNKYVGTNFVDPAVVGHGAAHLDLDFSLWRWFVYRPPLLRGQLRFEFGHAGAEVRQSVHGVCGTLFGKQSIF